MDLLQEIKTKITSLDGHNALDGIKAVIRHIEVAERYFKRAREDREEDLFNDVIYRTNQAFEGILKEAYTVLTNQVGARLSPHLIEQHLLNAQVLTPRVMELFKNYRQQWRNPSTHDYKLFFSEQEAVLAIVSISAFGNILLDQIIETVNFQREQAEIERRKEEIQETLRSYGKMPLHKKVIALLELFSEELMNSGLDAKELSEIEIIGRLNGFLESLDPNISIVREPLIEQARNLRPDFLLKHNEETVVVEVKRPGSRRMSIERGAIQLAAYLDAGKWQQGVLFIPPMPGEQVKTSSSTPVLNGREVFIHYVGPEQKS